MSAVGQQLGRERRADTGDHGRSPLAHLLHALNQPLTGLQCSLELALIGPRTPEQYVRTLRDGMELTGRMRVLVEAVRELAEADQEGTEPREHICLTRIVNETAEQLRPVAETRNLRIQADTAAELYLNAGRRALEAVVFRFLESALSLAVPGSVFHVRLGNEPGQESLEVAWDEGKEAPEHSPFSRQELGLLIARAGWQKIGAHWSSEHGDSSQRITVALPFLAQLEPKEVSQGDGK